MYCMINAGAIHGIDSYITHVEVDASNGMPGFEMVGLLNSEVRDVTMVRLIQSSFKESA